MHEMSLCEDVLDQLLEQSIVHGFTRVKTVWIEIGELSCVEPEALQFCFEAVMRGTLADHSTLEIVRVDGQASCEQCQQTIRVTQRYQACPDCGACPLKITAGEEMRIKELEVD